jgi:hypothetical protein
MKNRESQRAGFSAHGVERTFRLAKAAATARKGTVKGQFRLGDYVTAAGRAGSTRGRIVGQVGCDYLVEFYDYNEKRQERLAVNKLEPVRWKRFRVGDRIAVLWEGTPIQARVIRTDGDFHKISYAGWGPEWDEWALSERIVPAPAAPLRTAMVEWGGQWWPAVVLREENGKYRIHYAGYDKSWDEWVGKARIRFPEKGK